jgi:hypothetical protein
MKLNIDEVQKKDELLIKDLETRVNTSLTNSNINNSVTQIITNTEIENIYGLINGLNSKKFEAKIENQNLEKVFKNYYQPMNDIHSIKELKKKYPKIHIPQRPEDVIARKLESRITRDFYEDLDDAFILKDKKRAKELI